MKQQYKIASVTKSPQISKKQKKKLKQEFSNLNAKEMGILFNILDEYNKLKSSDGETSSTFFSNFEYMIHLLKEHHGITKRGKKEN